MSDYIKRLEDNWSVTDHGIATPEEVETAIVRLGADDARLAYRLQGYVASLLSDVERMRGALRVLVNAVHTVNDHQGRIVVDRHATEQARQALSAPNTEEGGSDG